MKSLYSSKRVADTQGLVYLAEINFLVCKKIYTSLPKNRMNANKFLLLSANNAFNEAVSILHTLLHSTKKEELTINPLLTAIIDREKALTISASDTLVKVFEESIIRDYPSPNYYVYDFLKLDDRLIGDVIAEIKKKKRGTALEDLKNLRKKFEEKQFHKIRHQTVAHKNKQLQNPTASSYLYLKDKLIEDLGKIVKELRILSYFWFDYEMRNPNTNVINDLGKLS